MSKERNPPSGLFSRSINLLSMAAQVATKEIGSRVIGEKNAAVIQTRIQQAKVIAEHLSQLKGAAMKAGQLLSLDTSDFLPPEALEILSQLQSKAQPAPAAEMKKILLKELGKERYGQIRNFSDEAHASASIGQLHRAEIKDKPVAIKIQYPGVAESIDTDLIILKKIAEGFVTVVGKKFSLDEAFSELNHVLHRETDYEIERINLEKYKALLVNDHNYALPETWPDYSTKKVLTMSFEKGMPILDWIKTQPSLKDRTQIAHLVLNLFCREFAEWGFVQTDPNFANFLVRENPLQLICLDFGAALNYTEDFRKGYMKLLRDLDTLDAEVIFQSAVEFGLIDPRESKETREAFKNMIIVTMEPFSPKKQPFRFTDPEFEKRTIEANIAFSRTLVYSPPPRKILFLHRKLGGIFNLVKRLGVELDLLPYWQKMIGQ